MKQVIRTKVTDSKQLLNSLTVTMFKDQNGNSEDNQDEKCFKNSLMKLLALPKQTALEPIDEVITDNK